MLIGFHTKQLTERGGDQAPFEFAVVARELLGLDVRFYVPSSADWIVPEAKRRFEEHFDVVFYDDPREIDADALYVHKRGYPGRITPHLPELNHAWNIPSFPHGHRFAVTSEWLARRARRHVRMLGRTWALRRLRRPPVVPNIVSLPETNEDLREELRIPTDAVVFARHGGFATFNLDFVHAAVRDALERRPELWFVFLNTVRFHEHERLVHLPLTVDRVAVRRFLNTADYMIHGVRYGEGFGLAVAEFALVGAPVLTYLGSPYLAHLDLLGDGQCLGYRDYADVHGFFMTLHRRTEPVSGDITTRFGREFVMERFDDVFLR